MANVQLKTLHQSNGVRRVPLKKSAKNSKAMNGYASANRANISSNGKSRGPSVPIMNNANNMGGNISPHSNTNNMRKTASPTALPQQHQHMHQQQQHGRMNMTTGAQQLASAMRAVPAVSPVGHAPIFNAHLQPQQLQPQPPLQLQQQQQQQHLLQQQQQLYAGAVYANSPMQQPFTQQQQNTSARLINTSKQPVSPRAGTAGPNTPTRPSKEIKSHHDLLRQHNEEMRLKEATKLALKEAHQTSFGTFVACDSKYGNLIVPVFPKFDSPTQQKQQIEEKNTV